MATHEMPNNEGTNITNYPSNSYARKDVKREINPNDKKIQRPSVQKGDVTRRPNKTIKRKLFELFLGDDAGSIVQYIVDDRLIPAVKNMIYDAISGGLQMRLFGSVQQRGTKYYRGDREYYNYSTNGYRRDERQDQKEKSRLSNRGRKWHEFDEITFRSKDTAIEIRDHLIEYIDQYDSVPVAEFYDCINEDTSPSDRDWGWTDLRTASVSYTPDGWVINFPPTEPLR